MTSSTVSPRALPGDFAKAVLALPPDPGTDAGQAATQLPMTEGERAAVDFYSQNPSAAVMDFLQRLQRADEHVVKGQTSENALPAVEGDLLPPIGSTVLIYLASGDKWAPHTVAGYYVWGDLHGNPELHRVFVRVVDSDDSPNARMLRDIRLPDGRYAAWRLPQGAEPEFQSPESLLDYAMAIAHERELQVGGYKHDEHAAVRSFNLAVQRAFSTPWADASFGQGSPCQEDGQAPSAQDDRAQRERDQHDAALWRECLPWVQTVCRLPANLTQELARLAGSDTKSADQ